MADITQSLNAYGVRPGEPAPDLGVELVAGGRFTLADRAPECFTMVVFFRGLHCPVCHAQLRELDRRLRRRPPRSPRCAEDHRGRGLGGRLLDAVDAELAARWIRDLKVAVMAGNEAAQRFYERCGLRPCELVLYRLGRPREPVATA